MIAEILSRQRGEPLTDEAISVEIERARGVPYVTIYAKAQSGETTIQGQTQYARAWKDGASLGLENDRLYLHGSAVTGNYLWFFDYLIFKMSNTFEANTLASLAHSVEGDAESIPCKSCLFDFTISCETLEHVLNVRNTLAEIIRCTKKTGYVILTIPNILNPIAFVRRIKAHQPLERCLCLFNV